MNVLGDHLDQTEPLGQAHDRKQSGGRYQILIIKDDISLGRRVQPPHLPGVNSTRVTDVQHAHRPR
jgi:hypothetical protein